MNWAHGFGNVNVRFDDARIRRDESVPYAWRGVREAFRGWMWVFCGMLGTVFGF